MVTKEDGSGLGSAVIEGESSLEAGAFCTVRLVYTAGTDGIAAGGALRVNLRHISAEEGFQAGDPTAAQYVSVTCSGDAKPRFNGRRGRWFPWQQGFSIHIEDAPLGPGETLTIVVGDTSGGGPGAFLQPFVEETFEFRITVDTNGDGVYRMLPDSPALALRGGAPVRVQIFTPSTVQEGEPFHATVKLEDDWGNAAERFEGEIRLEAEDGTVHGTHRFSAGERCAHRFDDIPARASGTHYLRLRTDTELAGSSNAIRSTAQRPEYRLYWGDLHGHTELGDGTGSVDDYYQYARDVAGLDFCAASEEDYLFTDTSWVRFIEAVKRYHEPGRFVTFLGYEWSGKVPGDHNVYYLDDTGPLYRSSTKYIGKTERLELRNEGMAHPLCRENAVVREIADLYKVLKGRRAMVIPHVGGNKTHLRFHDPELEPVLEVHSIHNSFEWFGMEALQRGYKVGFVGGGDSHDGRPGDAHTKGMHFKSGHNGLMGVYAKELTRESLWEAIWARRVYATSGERILVDFSMNDRFMGERVLMPDRGADRNFRISVAGLGKLAKIFLIKNNIEIADWSPGTKTATVEHADTGQDRPCDYYYLRVTQTDKHQAWSSPIWVADNEAALELGLGRMSY